MLLAVGPVEDEPELASVELHFQLVYAFETKNGREHGDTSDSTNGSMPCSHPACDPGEEATALGG